MSSASSQIFFLYLDTRGNVHSISVFVSVVVSSGHMREPWSWFSSDVHSIVLHGTNMSDAIDRSNQYVRCKPNCFPQNESSDGDSSSSTYGQIKTFESFFEVKMTQSFCKKSLVFLTNCFRAQIRWN